MEGTELKDLERKMQTLFNYEKQLVKETRGLAEKDTELENEISKVRQKLELLEQQVNLLVKTKNPEMITRKTFTPEQVAELKKTMSWSELSKYLHCSVSTCQRLVRKGRIQL